MKKLFAILLALLIASPSWAAVTIGTVVTATETGNDSSISLTIDVSGSNRLLVCGMGFANGTATAVSSITHNGTGLTQSAVGLIQVGGVKIDVWSLVAPATGSQTVTATMNGTSNKTLACYPISGADQVTPLGTGASFAATTDPATATITVPANGAGIAFAANADTANVGSFAVDGSSTKQYDFIDTDNNFVAIGSTKTATGAAAMTLSNPGTNYAAMIAVPINAAAAVTQRPIAPIILQ